MLAWLPRLRFELELLCAAHSVPLGVAVGWIEVESGGRLDEVTSLGERGYFQLLPAESEDLHLDHERLSADEHYSLAAGFRLIDQYRRIVTSYNAPGMADGSELHWRWTKLAHSIGAGACGVLVRDAARASACADWATFAGWCLRHDDEYLRRLKHSPAKWVGLVDRVFEVGRPYGVGILACPPPRAA